MTVPFHSQYTEASQEIPLECVDSVTTPYPHYVVMWEPKLYTPLMCQERRTGGGRTGGGRILLDPVTKKNERISERF